MSDFEYFATIGLFVAGVITLPILFHYRKKLIRAARIKMNLAKAKLHYMTRPQEDDILLPLDFEYIDVDNIKEESATWNTATYRERETR